ncbi:ABC transporter ATP-binding protein, partial [Candidatus Poseidonia sp.]|nr:ABC transporter ATP-binding protein [Poseidonia sp.]
MAEAVLSFLDVQHRHKIPTPRWSKPWAQRLGPGIVDLNLKLYKGSILGLVGPNGAGKTTLLRMMAGILPLQTGSVMQRIGNEWTRVADLRTLVGHMPEQVRWQGRTTVRNILLELGDMRGTQTNRIDALLNLVGLQQRQDEQLDNLSQGMRQRLSIAAALLGSPKVLLLDEPFNGLDPVAAQAFTELIQRLANKGVSIVISSHMVAQLGGFIDRIGLLHRGQLLDEGP